MSFDVGGASSAAPPAVRDEMPAKSPRANAYNELYSLARLTTNTEMVPKALRGRPDAAFSVMVYGAELGLEPMASLREIHIIEGTPACSANLMRALILRAGHVLEWRQWSNQAVGLYGRRRDNGRALLVTYTLDDAKRAEVAGKPNWKRYPRSMLAARATSELTRAMFADVLLGLAPYTPEELGAVGEMAAIDVDYVPDNVDPETGEILDPLIEDGDDPEPDESDPEGDDDEDLLWVEEARGDG